VDQPEQERHRPTQHARLVERPPHRNQRPEQGESHQNRDAERERADEQ